jgi:hypothetical protein
MTLVSTAFWLGCLVGVTSVLLVRVIASIYSLLVPRGWPASRPAPKLPRAEVRKHRAARLDLDRRLINRWSRR